MLKVGYVLIVTAGLGLLGYGGYHATLVLIRAPGIHSVVKGLILCACAGILLTLAGLVIEKRKEGEHASHDDESD